MIINSFNWFFTNSITRGFGLVLCWIGFQFLMYIDFNRISSGIVWISAISIIGLLFFIGFKLFFFDSYKGIRIFLEQTIWDITAEKKSKTRK